MARPRQSRLRIRGELVAKSPLHVGTLGGGIETDLPLYSDGQGRTCIPGTALTGTLRDWLRRSYDAPINPSRSLSNIDETRTGAVLGFQREGGGDDSAQGMASFVMVEDAPLIGDDLQEVWDGVGIDREYGAAADGIKFDRAVLPRGSRFQFEMTVDVPPDHVLLKQYYGDSKLIEEFPSPEEIRGRIAHLVLALTKGEVRLGAGQTRGLGRIQLDNTTVSIVHEDWSSKQGILETLKKQSQVEQLGDGNTDFVGFATSETKPHVGNTLDITIHWTPDGPLMVKGPADGMAVDILPFVSRNGAEISLTLPGSGIKGALRSQAERIMRTALGWDDASSWDERHRHLSQLNVPIVNELFGWAKPPEQQAKQFHGLGRGWLEVDTCYSENLKLQPEQWSKLAWASGSNDVPPAGSMTPLYQELESAGLRNKDRLQGKPYFEQAYHVAIDRWTGAAAEGFLYSAIEPLNIEWEPIQLTLTFPHFETCEETQKRQQAVLALLLLTLREMMQGSIPLGFGTNRGYGQVNVTNLSLSGQLEGGEWLVNRDITTFEDLFSGCPEEFRKSWGDTVDALVAKERAQA
ncbi:MAG: RAMP superfamily CRISPR-associated protein [Planctomycetaceae bacterium]